jgi:nucleoside-diphosphate-sugar epimerase
MTSQVLYNGATGGLGRHLTAALASRQLPGRPVRSRLGDTAGLGEELDHLSIEPNSALTFIQSAAIVSVPECEQDPERAFDVNVTRTAATVESFLEWARDRGHAPNVVFVSSGHVYAPPPPGDRLTESAPTHPGSVYATTKLEGEERIRTLSRNHGVDVVVARVFGLIGPDQPQHYLLPGLIRRVRTGDVSAVPGLDYVRDYLDARDVSRLLVSLASTLSTVGVAESVSTVNVCSGEPTRIGDLLDLVLTIVHQGDPDALQRARVAVGPAPGRPSDIEWSVGDPTRLSQMIAEPIRAISVADTIAGALAAGAVAAPRSTEETSTG